MVELNERANQLAHYLRSLGVGPDSLVGLCVERSAQTIVAVLAILKAGGAYVPLNPGQPKATARPTIGGSGRTAYGAKTAGAAARFFAARLCAWTTMPRCGRTNRSATLRTAPLPKAWFT